ncbi:MAG: protein translocase subunit SecD [Acidimicrobiia bacterium]|nr:protein translocase subunit SecD [Acidimicrobiia bacterium]
MKRKGLASIVFIVAIAAGLLGAALAQGWAPFLGLDLQGGVSVVLQPDGDADEEQLEDAVAIIRNRVDALGVAEPEITRQGQTIVVELPGVDDPEAAVELVGRTGELRFRPVLAELPPGGGGMDFGDLDFGDLDLDVEGIDLDDVDLEGLDLDELEGTATDPDDDADGGTEGDGADEGASGVPVRLASTASATQDIEPADPAEPSEPGEGVDDEQVIIDDPDDITLDMFDDETRAQLEALGAGGDNELTAPEDDLPGEIVVLPQYAIVDGERVEVRRFRLGPVALTGAGLETAQASLGGPTQSVWVVNLTLRGGPDGIGAFNDIAEQCFNGTQVCPTRQLAVTIDGEVETAPQIQEPRFAGNVQISGPDVDPFTQEEAEDLATVLRFGALPVELEVESRQQVSASLGRDALQAGLIAGAIGLGLVALYMLAFYRLLGLTALGMLVIEGALLWGVIAWLGSTQGLALTLAGITGIIVSIGVSLDSNIVFYETIKSDIRDGRSARSAAERSFNAAWKTIVKADVATLIAAALLYALAVGPVRGFAFYLGLATVLDLLVAWFFLRPAVAAMLRSKLCGLKPGLFGLPDTPTLTPGGGRPRPATDAVGARSGPADSGTDPATTGAV